MSSVSLSLNCESNDIYDEFLLTVFKGISNFIIGMVFLPLRNLLASGDASKEGRVFYVIAGVFAVSFGIFSRAYRG